MSIASAISHILSSTQARFEAASSAAAAGRAKNAAAAAAIAAAEAMDTKNVRHAVICHFLLQRISESASGTHIAWAAVWRAW